MNYSSTLYSALQAGCPADKGNRQLIDVTVKTACLCSRQPNLTKHLIATANLLFPVDNRLAYISLDLFHTTHACPYDRELQYCCTNSVMHVLVAIHFTHCALHHTAHAQSPYVNGKGLSTR